MASISFAQNTYAGEVLEDLLTYTAQGNDTYKEGLVHTVSNIQYKYTLPSINLGSIIQDNKATPVSPTDSKGTYTFRERYLEPKDFMVYLEFNPRDFETYWKPFQPDGELVFRTLDPKIQAIMLRLLIERKDEYIGNALWISATGDGTADATITAPAGEPSLGVGEYKYFDGIIKRVMDNIRANVAGEKVTVAGTTALADGAAVETALYAMWSACPKQIRTKNISFIMSWDLWDMYDKYAASKDYKYNDNTQVNAYRFKGKRIVPIVGVPGETILLGEFTQDMKSNLWMGVDYANDQQVVKIDKLQSNSELYFFQMRMKMDVNIVRPAEIVVWTNYTNV